MTSGDEVDDTVDPVAAGKARVSTEGSEPPRDRASGRRGPRVVATDVLAANVADRGDPILDGARRALAGQADLLISWSDPAILGKSMKLKYAMAAERGNVVEGLDEFLRDLARCDDVVGSVAVQEARYDYVVTFDRTFETVVAFRVVPVNPGPGSTS